MNNRGAALLVVYLIIFVLTIIGASFLERGVSETRIAQRYRQSAQAFWLAEAGGQRALWELNKNNCAGLIPCGTAVPCASCAACANVDKCLPGSLTSSGDYDASIYFGNSTISTTGSCPGRNATDRAQRIITADLVRDVGFKYAAFGLTKVGLASSVKTDSYDSALGDYGGSNLGSKGALGTNGTDSGVISMVNGCVIDGDITTGPAGTVSQGNGDHLNGLAPPQAGTQNNNVDFPVIQAPSDLKNLPDLGPYKVAKDGTNTITSGDYKYSKLTIGISGNLTITGTVRIYLTGSSALSAYSYSKIDIAPNSSLTIYSDGDVGFGNGVKLNTTTSIPQNFIIYSTYSLSGGMSMGDSGILYGAIYAPKTNIAFANGIFVYGSLIGDKVSLGDSCKIHYDEALGRMGGSSGYKLQNWQES